MTGLNDTVYYAVAGNISNLVQKEEAGDGLFIREDGLWVSTVKCKVQMEYRVSRCQWNGVSMVGCTEAPGANTTELDTVGLALLSNYLNAFLVFFAMQDETFLRGPTIAVVVTYALTTQVGHGRAPTTVDYTNMYRLIASCMVLDMSSGYYGTANVSTEDTLTQSVHSVRLPWLVSLALLVYLCLSQILVDLISARTRGSPICEMSFITVASATRERW
jgi:hypothetical protein